jgi:hypothetical protein
MDDDTLPYIPKELLDFLNKRFPERTPGLNDTVDQIRFESGQREVVRFLNKLFIDQNNNLLSRRVTNHV